MAIAVSELDQMQEEYKAASDEWIATIQAEQSFALRNHSETQIDQWEAAGCREEAARDKAKSAKKTYESALRQEFFDF